MKIYQSYALASGSNGNMKDSFGLYISLSRSNGTSHAADYYLFTRPKIILYMNIQNKIEASLYFPVLGTWN